eukprot:NODE_1071_length_2338_cov_0.438589.p1 type:complete len:397 gc:universal NODE_1071_length_2338_cov_0.438589:1424-234(-)
MMTASIILLHLLTISHAYQHCVIGSGPAGSTLVGELLSLKYKSQNNEMNVVWIAHDFNGGALQDYKEIPGNAKVGKYLEWSKSNSYFEMLSVRREMKALQELNRMKRSDEPVLKIVHQLVYEYTKELRKHVEIVKGHVESIEYENEQTLITVTQSGCPSCLRHRSMTIKCDQLYLAQGGIPKINDGTISGFISESTKKIPIIKAMTGKLKKTKKYIVVGNSHSAMLVLRNLHRNGVRAENVNVFHKSDDKYVIATQNEDGTIKNALRGLKGEASKFATEILDKKVWFPKFEQIQGNVDYASDIKDFDYIIYAIGFQPAPIPITYDGEELNAQDLRLNKETMKLEIQEKQLDFYGLGIAYPQRIDDEGHSVALAGLSSVAKSSKEIVKNLLENEANQ